MTTEPTSTPTSDLSFPPDPYHHGPCRVTNCTFGADGGPAPAVFEGGLCAKHADVIGNLSIAAGLQERAAKQEAHRPSGLKGHLKARRKAASASRSRNRR